MDRYILFFQYKSFIRLQSHFCLVISVLHIGDQAGCAHKLFWNGEGCLVVTEAAYDQKFFILQGSCVDEPFFAVFEKQLVAAVYHDRILFAQRDQFLVIVEYRIGICCFRFGIDLLIVRIIKDDLGVIIYSLPTNSF